ncbi:hypothetical protein KCU67_g15147, partial [Aureobasidium melanogenum]
MSAVSNADAASKSASKKKRKNKKKANDTTKSSTDTTDVNGANDDPDDDGDDDDVASRKPSVAALDDTTTPQPLPLNDPQQTSEPTTQPDHDAHSETAARMDAMVKERDDLRQELVELRKSLDSIQEKHHQETEELKTQAQNDKTTRDNAEIDQLRKSLQSAQDKHKQE